MLEGPSTYRIQVKETSSPMGVLSGANTCLVYLLQEELDFPPLEKPLIMVLAVFLEHCSSILKGKLCDQHMVR